MRLPRRRNRLRLAGGGRHLRGRVLGEPQHGLLLAPASALRSGRQRLRHIGARHVSSRPAPISELVKGFPDLSVHRLDGRDYFEVRKKVPEIVASVRRGQGPALVHATVTRPYSHSSADTQSKYRPKHELDEEAWTRPDRGCWNGPSSKAQLLSPDEMAADARRSPQVGC